MVDTDVCWEPKGKAPVSTRWMDSIKATEEELEMRNMWIARDVKVKGEKNWEDLWVMPPLDALKLLFRRAMVRRAMVRQAMVRRQDP